MLTLACIVAVAMPTAPVSSEPNLQPNSVAIVGGGAAGSVLALELLGRGKSTVTVFETALDLLSSTSANIAATVNLDTYTRTFEDHLKEDGLDRLVNLAEQGAQFVDSMDSMMAQRWRAWLGNVAAAAERDQRAASDQRIAFYNHSAAALNAAAGVHGAVICDHMRTPLANCPGNEACSLWTIASSGCDEVRADLDAGYEVTSRAQTRNPFATARANTAAYECAISASTGTGFMRTQAFYTAVTTLLGSNPAASLRLGTSVLSLTEEISSFGTRRPCVTVETGTECFDRVVVAASVASIPLLDDVDPFLEQHLIGIKGYGMLYPPAVPLSAADRDEVAVKLKDQASTYRAAYFRATVGGDVVGWGGHEATLSNSLPPAATKTSEELNDIFEHVATPAEVAAATMMVGLRPVPTIIGMPLLKTYPAHPNVILNTGYGYHGYDLAWGSASCVADFIETGLHSNPVCQTAFKQGAEEDTLWRWWEILLVGLAVLAGLVCLISLLLKLCANSTQAAADAAALAAETALLVELSHAHAAALAERVLLAARDAVCEIMRASGPTLVVNPNDDAREHSFVAPSVGDTEGAVDGASLVGEVDCDAVGQLLVGNSDLANAAVDTATELNPTTTSAVEQGEAGTDRDDAVIFAV